MKTPHQASAQARHQRRGQPKHRGQFVAEGKPAATAPLDTETPSPIGGQDGGLVVDPSRTIGAGEVSGYPSWMAKGSQEGGALPTATESALGVAPAAERVAENVRGLIGVADELAWDASGAKRRIRECSALEDVAMELAAKRDRNVEEITDFVEQDAVVIEEWDWEDDPHLTPGTVYAIARTGDGDFGTELSVAYRSFSHFNPETGKRSGECEVDLRVGVASSPEMFATWLRDDYSDWQDTHPGHLDSDCSWLDDPEPFRSAVNRRWEDGEFSNPLDWAHWSEKALGEAKAERLNSRP